MEAPQPLTKTFDAVVIGAGPAGITAAHRIAEAGQSVVLVEASPGVGGLARSIEVFGGRVDVGPHRFFSNDRRVNEEWVEAVDYDYVMVDRVTRIFYDGKFFDYPLKPANALLNLGLIGAIRSFLSYLYVKIKPPKGELDTFDKWVTSRFGAYLYEIFFKTYSERLWGIPCDQLDADFAAQRIKKFSLGEAVKASLGAVRGSRHKTLVDRFAYPRTGAGLVYERLAEKFEAAGGQLLLEAPVASVDLDQGKVVGVTLENGDRLLSDQVVSTMPLTLMVRSLGDIPPEVTGACEALGFRNTTLVYVRLDRPSPFPDQWIYIHDPSVQMGRLTNFSNWSPEVGGPPGGTTLCAEYWSNDEDEFWGLDDGALSRLAREDLVKTGLVPADSIGETRVIRIHRCYPVYAQGYQEHVSVIQEFIDGIDGLYAIGRYGAFKYNNQDHSILMGILAADNVVNGASNDLWSVNTDYDSYQEEAAIDETGLVSI